MEPKNRPAPPGRMRCPNCGYVWRNFGLPPIEGYWPQIFRCHGPKCRRRHWFLVVRIQLDPWPPKANLVCVVASPPTREQQREVLLTVDVLDERVVDLALACMHELRVDSPE